MSHTQTGESEESSRPHIMIGTLPTDQSLVKTATEPGKATHADMMRIQEVDYRNKPSAEVSTMLGNH